MTSTTRSAALCACLAVLALGLAPRTAAASESLAKSTGKACVACHDKPGSRLLTDPGKYFEVKRTLEGYDRIKSSFGRCTSCHANRPGSLRLTKQGKRFAEVVRSMDELQAWMKEGHTLPPAPRP